MRPEALLARHLVWALAFTAFASARLQASAPTQRTSRRGTAAIEYAIVLACLLLVLVSAYVILGSSLAGAHAKIAAAVEESTSATSAVRSSLRPRYAETTKDDALAPPTAQNVEMRGTDDQLICLMAVVAVVATAICAHRFRRMVKAANRLLVQHDEKREARYVLKRQQMLRLLAGAYELDHASHVQVKHVKTTNVVGVPPSCDAQTVKRIFCEQAVRHLLVLSDGRLLGIISDRDLRKSDAATAAELMTENPLVVQDDTPLENAITYMMHARISCLPVVAEGRRVVGVLTTVDIMLAMQCVLRLLQEEHAKDHSQRKAPRG